jgi:chromosomal replication initiation ATPase DnaA
MSQIALPLSAGREGPSRIVVGSANQAVFEAMALVSNWPFRTALLLGPPRSGKSLIARWFAQEGMGEAIDDAHLVDEAELFHRWNRAQEDGRPLLLVAASGWTIALPDLASRLGAALQLEFGTPDDAMLEDLLALHAELRGLALGLDGIAYLVPRIERSHIEVERIVAAIDRLSLERKAPPTLGIWREALEELHGPREPRLL